MTNNEINKKIKEYKKYLVQDYGVPYEEQEDKYFLHKLQQKKLKNQLNHGKSVKATDLMSSLGISVHHM